MRHLLFHNELPGADINAIDPLPALKHTHKCPMCHEKRECAHKWCQHMADGYMKDGVAYQPVDLMCDKCAGITEAPRRMTQSSIEISTEGRKRHGRRA